MRVYLTLISRSYCHLCHEMELGVRTLAEEYGFELNVLDVDADPELIARFDDRVPVLIHEGQELSQYFLEVAKVRDYLSKIG